MWNFIVQGGEMMVQLHIQQKMVTELNIPTFLNVIQPIVKWTGFVK